MGGALLLDNLDWTIAPGEHWALTGRSGSGKTVLAHTLLGRHFHTGQITITRRTAIVEQQHRFRNRPGSTELYYQQRFNASDADQTITVAQEIADAGWPDPDPTLIDLLHINPLLQKPLIQLSNGENKRVQLAIAVLNSPDFLILDNPFLGLDVEGRATLHDIINKLRQKGIQLLLITNPHELPAAITHVAELSHGKWVYKGDKAGFPVIDQPQKTPNLDATLLEDLRMTAAATAGAADFTFAVRMIDTNIRYGENTILQHINWEVRKGERWNVSGPNGAGKSTLLSLITADNPQAYANEIWLFDRRRGTGESIWDIKKKIGFVSPELHLYFDTGATTATVIASGLFDTIGLFRTLDKEQEAAVERWIQLLSLQAFRNRRLAQLSTGQQRMALLARALIKNPPLLILDEPCQGLDEQQTSYLRDIITTLCETFGTTLIYVSHYQQDLPACIDQWLRLDKGVAQSL